jgi:hypothetical protein
MKQGEILAMQIIIIIFNKHKIRKIMNRNQGGLVPVK